MEKLKVVKIENESIVFDNGLILYSNHDQDCCEHHYLDFKDINIEDFEGLFFDLSKDDFFERIENFGIALKPINGHPVRIPGYGNNNGYYSSNLELVISKNPGFEIIYDISECQEYEPD